MWRGIGEDVAPEGLDLSPFDGWGMTSSSSERGAETGPDCACNPPPPTSGGSDAGEQLNYHSG